MAFEYVAFQEQGKQLFKYVDSSRAKCKGSRKAST